MTPRAMTQPSVTQPSVAPPSTASRGPGRPALDRTRPLTLDDILDEAMRILRTESRDALSMRRLASDLGVTPMAIYHYVKDKPALIDALLERVWAQIRVDQSVGGDPIEYLVSYCVHVRQVWLENFELASLAVAVAAPDAPDDLFFRTTRSAAFLFEAAGFPDVPLAYSAVQNFTMGCVQVAANRRVASVYFGRDPDHVELAAKQLLVERGATADHLGVVEARFDTGDDKHFGPALRALIAGLLAGPAIA